MGSGFGLKGGVYLIPSVCPKRREVLRGSSLPASTAGAPVTERAAWAPGQERPSWGRVRLAVRSTAVFTASAIAQQRASLEKMQAWTVIKTQGWVGKMIQWVKACREGGQSEFSSRTSMMEREPAPESRPLTFTHSRWDAQNYTYSIHIHVSFICLCIHRQ